MRAREFILEEKSFTINIPINITIPSGNGDPQVSMKESDSDNLPDIPVNVFPLQQELELLKHSHGKQSRVINQILKDDGADSKLADKINYEDLSEDFDDIDKKYQDLMNELSLIKKRR